MFCAEVKDAIEKELANGEEARLGGYEGRARVCARRAAGAAVKEYFRWRGAAPRSPSVYHLLDQFQRMPGHSVEMSALANRLLRRVDEDYTLPPDIDLLADARRLIAELEKLSVELS